jgi:hypothetical protein
MIRVVQLRGGVVNGEGFYLDAKPPILITDEISTAPALPHRPEGLPVIVGARGNARVAAAIEFFTGHHSQPQHSDGVRARALHDQTPGRACRPHLINLLPHLSYERITTYLRNGGTLEHAQAIANHESPRATKLYDRTARNVVRRGRADINLSGSIRL